MYVSDKYISYSLSFSVFFLFLWVDKYYNADNKAIEVLECKQQRIGNCCCSQGKKRRYVLKLAYLLSSNKINLVHGVKLPLVNC